MNNIPEQYECEEFVVFTPAVRNLQLITWEEALSLRHDNKIMLYADIYWLDGCVRTLAEVFKRMPNHELCIYAGVVGKYNLEPLAMLAEECDVKMYKINSDELGVCTWQKPK